MYRLHRYWSKKPSDAVADLVDKWSPDGGIVLDPFCGSGVVLGEAVRLGRRAVGIDINPMAVFISRTMLSPVNLSQMVEAFECVKSRVASTTDALYATTCIKCGGHGIVDFVTHDNERSVRIGYRCACAKERLFKEPSRSDLLLEQKLKKSHVPFPYPDHVEIPTIQRERFQFVHELFSRRNLIALSTILHEIRQLSAGAVQDSLLAAFTSAVDKASRLKPQEQRGRPTRPTLSQGWVALRFYAPRYWQEVNPLLAFTSSFHRVFAAKKDSNRSIGNVRFAERFEDLERGQANVLLLRGPAQHLLRTKVPTSSIDYVLTDPPFGDHIQYSALSTLWGAWLGMSFDLGNEIVVSKPRGKTPGDYVAGMRSVFRQIARTAKSSSCVHCFYEDTRGPYMASLLTAATEVGLAPERIVRYSPSSSFGEKSRRPSGHGHYGSYIIWFKHGAEVLDRPRPEAAARRTRTESNRTAPQGFPPSRSELEDLKASRFLTARGSELVEFARLLSLQVGIGGQHGSLEIAPSQMSISFSNDEAKKKDAARSALLDARSLLCTSERDQSPLAYQYALSVTGGLGVTFDDLRSVAGGISSSAVSRRRRQRIRENIAELGRLMGLEVALTSDCGSSVTEWRARDLTVKFRPNPTGIEVSASSGNDMSFEPTDVGTITDIDLEIALGEWSRANSLAAATLWNRLFPVANSSSTERPQAVRTFARVVANKKVCSGHYLLTLRLPAQRAVEPLGSVLPCDLRPRCDTKAAASPDAPRFDTEAAV